LSRSPLRRVSLSQSLAEPSSKKRKGGGGPPKKKKVFPNLLGFCNDISGDKGGKLHFFDSTGQVSFWGNDDNEKKGMEREGNSAFASSGLTLVASRNGEKKISLRT